MSDDHNHGLAASQEERLQTVEGTLGGVAISIAKLSTTHEFILEKLDAGFKNIHEGQSKINAELLDGQAKINAQVKPLVDSHTRKVKRWETSKKLIFPAIAAAAGVFGSTFSHQIITTLSTLFGGQ